MDNEKINNIREALLRKPYRIIDVLPARTPARFAGAYSALEKHYFRAPAANMPYARFLDLIIKLGCYCETAVCRPDDDKWVCPPDPELLFDALNELAVTRMGGAVSAEHGVGKLKRDFLTVMYGKEHVREMAALKAAFDPDFLFGRGNLFAGTLLKEAGE